MKVKYQNSLKCKMLKRIASLPSNVVLRSDLADLGGYRQISTVIKFLQNEGNLVRIAFGIYAKARITTYYDKAMPCGGFDVVAREALDRLNIIWESGLSERAYNEGQTSQIPAKNIIRLKTRFRRKIQYEGRKLYFEKSINAR